MSCAHSSGIAMDPALDYRAEHSSEKPPIVVLGAGIVGICTASYLQRAGHRVLVIDRQAPGEAATFGNAGCINGSSVVPTAMPGVLKHVPKWLLDPQGPLVMRWRYLPTLAPWLIRFIASGEANKVAAQARALRALVGASLSDYAPLIQAAGLQDLIFQRGHLIAYTSDEGYAGDAGAMALRARNGVQIEDIGRGALRDLEPDLSHAFLRARRIAETGHVSDPGQFTKRMALAFVAAGGRILQSDIHSLQTTGGRVSGVLTGNGVVPVQSVVIALGAWSATLTRQLGDSVLLDTERGYHIEVPQAPCDAAEMAVGAGPAGPRVPTLWSEGKMFATPMEGRVRAAGTVEFAGLDAPPDWRRADLLAQQLATMYPRINQDIERVGTAHLPRWLGFRPSTPDSLPVIGPASQYPNAIYAYGHGHIGLTAAASTGRVVAALLGGQPTGVDLQPFSIGRF
jgi:D-amino-acid dehydrogenase